LISSWRNKKSYRYRKKKKESTPPNRIDGKAVQSACGEEGERASDRPRGGGIDPCGRRVGGLTGRLGGKSYRACSPLYKILSTGLSISRTRGGPRGCAKKRDVRKRKAIFLDKEGGNGAIVSQTVFWRRKIRSEERRSASRRNCQKLCYLRGKLSEKEGGGARGGEEGCAKWRFFSCRCSRFRPSRKGRSARTEGGAFGRKSRGRRYPMG